jgi:hypothetical protein
VCRVSDAAWFFLRPSTRSRARLLPAASSTLNTYKFSNAANDGKLLGQDGRYKCLGSADVMGFVTNELMIVTSFDAWHKRVATWLRHQRADDRDAQ